MLINKYITTATIIHNTFTCNPAAALSVFAYVAGFVLCIMGGSVCDSPLIWLTLIDERIRIEGTVGWIEWILNTFFGFDDF